MTSHDSRKVPFVIVVVVLLLNRGCVSQCHTTSTFILLKAIAKRAKLANWDPLQGEHLQVAQSPALLNDSHRQSPTCAPNHWIPDQFFGPISNPQNLSHANYRVGRGPQRFWTRFFHELLARPLFFQYTFCSTGNQEGAGGQ